MSVFQRSFNEWYERLSRSVHEFTREHGFRPTKQQKRLLDAVQTHATLVDAFLPRFRFAVELSGLEYDGPFPKLSELEGHIPERFYRALCAEAEAVHAARQIAVKSGQGPGKTTITGFVGVWRAFRQPGGVTCVTAPTMRQCKEVWLAEYRRQHAKASKRLQRMISVTATRVIILGDTNWGVRLVTSSRPEGAQGLHQDNLTIICEEASGIDRTLIEQFEGTQTNYDSLWLMVGNPNTRDCYFFDCFNGEREKWVTMTFSCEDTPLVNPLTIREHEKKYGRDSDFFRVRVLGEFPFADPRSVISSEELEACTKPALQYKLLSLKDKDTGRVRKQIGIDFARFGGDESVIYVRRGGAIIQSHILRHVEPITVARKAMEIQRRLKWTNEECTYVVDAGGMGQGVLGLFYESSKRVVEFHNGGRAYDTYLYDDRITEAMFTFADRCREGEIYIPNDNRLIAQLSNRWYFTTRPRLADGGAAKLVLESKDDYIKRGHKSPDRADALVLAFYDAGMGGDRVG